jgi:uncharacterized phage-associated protein
MSALDVAAYILARRGEMPAIKLQKLVYYSQAWSLVWDDAPLFDDRIEAWANGPVIPTLYAAHRGTYMVRQIEGGDPARLTSAQRETIDVVIDFYGDKSSQWLSNLTHMETPWQSARSGLAPNERGNEEITLESMAEYYSSLM